MPRTPLTPELCTPDRLYVVLTNDPERSDQPGIEHLAWRVGNTDRTFIQWIVLSAVTPGMTRWYEDKEITVVAPYVTGQRPLPATPADCLTWNLFWVRRHGGPAVMAWRTGYQKWPDNAWALLDLENSHITWCGDDELTIVRYVMTLED